MAYNSNIIPGALGYVQLQAKQNKSASFTVLVQNSTGSNINVATYTNAVITAWTTAKNSNTVFTFDSNGSNYSNIGRFDGRFVININASTLNVIPRSYAFDFDVTADDSNYSGYFTGSIDVQAGR